MSLSLSSVVHRVPDEGREDDGTAAEDVVRAEVLVQVVGAGEGLVAHGAGEALLAGVRAGVTGKLQRTAGTAKLLII